VTANDDDMLATLEKRLGRLHARIRMLPNEQVKIERGGAAIHLAGVDDAHFYRMDNMEKAAHGIPHDAFSILLSHTPEIYRQAAHADFNVLLSGHTHGGQMCLPGGIPITLNCVLPRSMGNGSFKHHDMIGYTSAGAGACIVPTRFNCPPEITLHIACFRVRRLGDQTAKHRPKVCIPRPSATFA
jgi:uncharacterized protein